MVSSHSVVTLARDFNSPVVTLVRDFNSPVVTLVRDFNSPVVTLAREFNCPVAMPWSYSQTRAAVWLHPIPQTPVWAPAIGRILGTT